jgi:DNA-binding GntR family transcriptional regulator
MPALSAPATRTKTEAAFLALRDAIEEGRLRPGERLLVSRLIDELGMSPTPIREALRLLQAQGLAAYSAHHGMVVAEYSPEDVAEVSRIRVELEPLAVALAVERASADEVAEMREAHDALRAAHEGQTPRSDAASLNAAWHAAVYRPAASPLLTDFIARLWAGVPVEAVWRSSRADRSLREHEEIMEAIERGDAGAARELMRRHIEGGSQATIAHMRAEHP